MQLKHDIGLSTMFDGFRLKLLVVNIILQQRQWGRQKPSSFRHKQILLFDMDEAKTQEKKNKYEKR